MPAPYEFDMPNPDDPTPTPAPGSEVPRPPGTGSDAPRTASVRTTYPHHPNSEPRRSSSPTPAILAIVLALAVAVGLGAAWSLGYWPFGPRNRPPGPDQPAPVASTNQDKDNEGSNTNTETDVEPVVPPPAPDQADLDRVARDDLEELSKRLDKLQARIDQKSESRPDVQSLESRLHEVETLPDAVKTLTEKLQGIDDRLLKAETTIEGLESRLKHQEQTASRSPSGPRAARPEDELQRGMDLFRAGRFREAREVFDRLTQSLAPNDARAWYYDALATGLSTGDWRNAAPRLAREGVKREKAGSPSPDKIDAALDDLTEPTGRDWIASYRNRIE